MVAELLPDNIFQLLVGNLGAWYGIVEEQVHALCLHVGGTVIVKSRDAMIVQTLTQLVTPHVQALWVLFAQYGLEGRQAVIVKLLIAAIRRSVAVRPEALQIIAEGEAIPQFLLTFWRHIAGFFQ